MLNRRVLSKQRRKASDLVRNCSTDMLGGVLTEVPYARNDAQKDDFLVQ